MGYVDLSYRPGKNDLVCEFRVEPANSISIRKAAGAVAGESSVGTWTDVNTSKPYIKRLAAKVFEIRGNCIRVAYPLELFEPGNVPQILSSIAGNIFGMKIVKNLRLEDIHFPKKLMKSFHGPELGISDIRKITKIKNRPLAGTIYKPKLGLNPKEMADLAYKIYSNGIDFSKDDENLCSMKFNRFEDRVVKMLDVVDKIKTEHGRNVIYAPNITAPAQKMLERAQFVKDHGGKCIMIDIITSGWSALQFIRDQNFKMIIHAHRASHASFTRNKKQGIRMIVIAKMARLIGVSSLHTGTVVGKLEGSKQDISKIDNFLRSDLDRIKKVMPVASGGLHPALIPEVIKLLGKDLIINCGGGLWGHPDGPESGAKAIRQSIDASVKKIPLKKYAQTRKELRLAVERWSAVK